MKYTKGYKFRLYPNKAQATLLNKMLDCCRFIFKDMDLISNNGANLRLRRQIQNASAIGKKIIAVAVNDGYTLN